MLNNMQGVTPYAFLPGKQTMPKSMRDVSGNDLSILVYNHVCNEQVLATPFSSWSPDIGTALYFATGHYARLAKVKGASIIDPRQCSIAVLDTWKVFSLKERPYRVSQMAAIGVPRYECEYLVYGRVSGPAYTLVLIEGIQEAVECLRWPCCPTRQPMSHPLTIEELEELWPWRNYLKAAMPENAPSS